MFSLHSPYLLSDKFTGYRYQFSHGTHHLIRIQNTDLKWFFPKFHQMMQINCAIL